MNVKTNYFVCGAIQKNKIYWQNRDDGDFCCFDLNTNTFKYLYTMGKMNFSAVICADDNYVYGISESGKLFWKYSLLHDKIYMFEINCQGYALDWVCNSVLTESYLVIIPSRAEIVVWINIKNGNVVAKNIKNEVQVEHEKRIYVNEKVFLGQINHNNKMVAFNYKDGYVLEVDYINLIVKKNVYPKEIGEIADVEYINGLFYILNEQGALYNFNLESGTTYFIADGYNGMERLFENKETIWLLPRCEGKILNIDLRGSELQKYEYPKKTRFDKKVIYDPYMTNNGYKIENKKIICFSIYGCNYIFFIDKKTNVGKFYNCFNFDEDNMKLYYSVYKNDVFYEKNNDLIAFLDYISTDL